MKKVFLLTILLSLTFIGKAQNFLSLDSCRALALANNKDLLIRNEKINAAHYQRKAAFTNYLPNFSATGAYMRNQKEFSLLNNDQKAVLSGLGPIPGRLWSRSGAGTASWSFWTGRPAVSRRPGPFGKRWGTARPSSFWRSTARKTWRKRWPFPAPERSRSPSLSPPSGRR